MMNAWWKCSHHLLMLVTVFFSMDALAVSPAQRLSQMSVPNGARLEIVSGNMQINGRLMAVATIQSSSSLESVLDFYRQDWAADERWALPGSEGKPSYIESSVPGWKLISQLIDGHSVVVQLHSEQGNQTTGLISVATLTRGVSTIDHGVFGNMDMLSSNLSVDGADTSSMRVYGSMASAQRTRDRYRDLLVRKGWRLMADTSVDSGLITQLGRDNVRLELAFMDSKEFASVVVVHEVTSK